MNVPTIMVGVVMVATIPKDLTTALSTTYKPSGDKVTCIGESKLTYLALKIVHSGMYMYKNNGTYLLYYTMRHAERVHTRMKYLH